MNNTIEGEKSYQWNGNIGLITASEYVRSNINEEACGNINDVYSDYDYICKSTTWMYNNDYWWPLSPFADDSAGVWYVRFDGNLGNYRARSERGVRPAIYLNSNLTLTGSGTSSDPYVPVD